MILVAQVDGAEIELLDFWSPSCGPCMQLKPTIQNFQKANYPIREVEVSSNPELVRKFNVQRMPCLVMLVDGQEVDRTVGFTSGERLQQMFERAKSAVENRARLRHQSPDSFADLPAARPRAALSEEPAERIPAGRAASPSQAGSHANLLASTVRLRVDDATGHSYGTGTIIDTRSGQALVITCGHLFRESKGKSPISVELF
jgi:thiol-disulfide isomerase/thioredoxin